LTVNPIGDISGRTDAYMPELRTSARVSLDVSTTGDAIVLRSPLWVALRPLRGPRRRWFGGMSSSDGSHAQFERVGASTTHLATFALVGGPFWGENRGGRPPTSSLYGPLEAVI
jgi:hypothetical protein